MKRTDTKIVLKPDKVIYWKNIKAFNLTEALFEHAKLSYDNYNIDK